MRLQLSFNSAVTQFTHKRQAPPGMHPQKATKKLENRLTIIFIGDYLLRVSIKKKRKKKVFKSRKIDQELAERETPSITGPDRTEKTATNG